MFQCPLEPTTKSGHSYNPVYRYTLAAAYAEAEQFNNAVPEQERTIEILKAAGQTDNIADFESRLDLYRQNKPYHQEPN